jgi:drug/metabolite transporter (DMT)-like permease
VSGSDRRIAQGMLLAIASTLCFAITDALCKLQVRSYPTAMIVWARYAIPLLLVVALFLPGRGRALLRTARPGVQLRRGVLLTSATMLIVLAYRTMPLAEAQAISFLHPVLLTVMASLVLHERVGRATWIAVVLGFVGVLVIVRPGGAVFTWTALLPFVNALCYSSYQVLTRTVASHDDTTSSLTWILLIGTAMSSVVLPFAWVAPDLPGALLFLLIGALAGVGHYCTIGAFERAPAARLAPLGYAQLLWISALGLALFGDFPDPLTWLGIGIVVAGGLLVAAARRGPEPGAPVNR